MRASKSKSDLKKGLQVDTSEYLQQKLNVVIIDECVQLWWTNSEQNDDIMKNLTDTPLQLVLTYFTS